MAEKTKTTINKTTVIIMKKNLIRRQRYKKKFSPARSQGENERSETSGFMKSIKLVVDVLDNSDNGTEEDTALAEVPQRRVMDDVFFRKEEVKPNERMA